MIQQPREPLQLKKDGVHLTVRDFTIIAKAIENHSHAHLQAAQTYLGVITPQPNINKAMAKCSLLSLPARNTTHPTAKSSTQPEIPTASNTTDTPTSHKNSPTTEHETKINPTAFRNRLKWLSDLHNAKQAAKRQ